MPWICAECPEWSEKNGINPVGKPIELIERPKLPVQFALTRHWLLMFDVMSLFDVCIIDSMMSTATVPATNYIVGPVNVYAHSRVFF
ncbi:hypothetical protein D3C76_288300 [compost metagenome]